MGDGYIKLDDPIDIVETLELKNQHSTEKLARVKVSVLGTVLNVRIHDNHTVEVEPPTIKATIKNGKIIGFQGYDTHI